MNANLLTLSLHVKIASSLRWTFITCPCISSLGKRPNFSIIESPKAIEREYRAGILDCRCLKVLRWAIYIPYTLYTLSIQQICGQKMQQYRDDKKYRCWEQEIHGKSLYTR